MFNFPDAPTTGDVYTPAGGPAYQWDGTVWNQRLLSAYVLKLGDTMTGPLIINSAAGHATVTLSTNVTGAASILIGTKGVLNRWGLYLGDGTAESTGNAGSNFALFGFSDAGTYLNNPITVNRATGNINLTGCLTLTGTNAVSPQFLIAPTNPSTGVTLGLRKSGAANNNNIVGQSYTGVYRWNIVLGDSAGETGSNVGTNFVINRYDDLGNALSNPLAIDRATGEVTINTLRLTNNSIGLGSTLHPFQIGATSTYNLRMDQNQIQAVNNGVASGIYLNYNGGAVSIGTNAIANSSPLIVNGPVVPQINGGNNLGSTTARWGVVYTSDLSLSNGIGEWTIVEGEDDLFIYNDKRGKVYKFALTEVDPATATPKKVTE